MFIFKYITPFAPNFSFIKANHLITLFIISKKAYHDMKAYTKVLNDKRNVLELYPFFN